LLSGIVGAVVVLLYQNRVDRARREPGLAVRFVTNDVFVFVQDAAVASATAGVTVTRDGEVVSPPPPPTPAPPPAPAAPPPAPAGFEVLHLLVRNLSERPSGIVDLKLLRADGAEVAIPIREYRKRLAVPLVLPAWGVHSLQLRIDDAEMMPAETRVLVDMDDKELRLLTIS
jgi:hypothetical protein